MLRVGRSVGSGEVVMEVIVKETDSIQAMSDSAVLSYVYEQSGFSIDLNKCFVRLFNNASGINAVYDYNQIREINYTLPNTDFRSMQRSVFSHLEATMLYGNLLLSRKAAKEFVRDGLTYLMSRYLTEYKIKHKMLILL